MDMKIRDFVSDKVFSLKSNNLISFIAVTTLVACTANTLWFFYSIVSNGYYSGVFTLLLTMFLSVFVLLVYFFISLSFIKNKNKNMLGNILRLFFVDKKISSIKKDLVGVNILILDKMEQVKNYSACGNGAATDCHENVIINGLSSALYLLDMVSVKVSSMGGAGFYHSANVLPEYVLNKAIRFCDFKFLSIKFRPSNGIGSCLTVCCQDDTKISLFGDSVDSLVRNIVSIEGLVSECEYKMQKDEGGGCKPATTAEIRISNNEILLKIM